MDLLQSIFRIIQGILTHVASSASTFFDGGVSLPDSIIARIEVCGFFESIPLWLVALIGALIITVLSCVMLLTVYSRFFKLYMYTAIAPIPMSSFAGEGTAQVGRQFLKSYAGVCLQGAIIILACIIYSVFAESAPTVDEGASAAAAVWSYLLELILNMLVLVGAVRMSDRIILAWETAHKQVMTRNMFFINLGYVNSGIFINIAKVLYITIMRPLIFLSWFPLRKPNSFPIF